MEIFALLDGVTQTIFLGLVFVYVLWGLDDYFIDSTAWSVGLRPKRLTPRQEIRMNRLSEKRIAILIANWQEAGIIEKMIQGNLQRVDYRNYAFILGVYPNDTETFREAQRLAEKYERVELVVNRAVGPTSKGQMLNEVFLQISDIERKQGAIFDAFMIHDSEDILHPKSLKLINMHLDEFGFVQIPIFSLPLSPLALTAGIYMDEFAEVHTKDILVRSYLGAAIPSAGVGTAISRVYRNRIFAANESVLNENSVTEDYELGMRTKEYGIKSCFLAYWYKNVLGEREFIATREYFPNRFWPAVRQKTRWTVGIAFQAWENLGWRNGLVDRYFSFRDRKGPLSNILVLMGMLVSSYFGLRFFMNAPIELIYDSQILRAAGILTALFMVNRIFQRFYCTWRVYGLMRALLSPFRMLLGNIINSLAAIRAVYQFAKSKLTGSAIGWAKTEHRLPTNFGGVES